MAMNIPAPVQILRYDIPENTTFEQVTQYIVETIKDGMLLIVTGNVIVENYELRESFEIVPVGLFIVGAKYDGRVTPIIVPMQFGFNGISINRNFNGYTAVIDDIFPQLNNNDRPFSERGLLTGAIYRTNIDFISEYGIYWPDATSTLPDGIDSSDYYVLHYANNRNSRHFQFFMCSETSTPGSISDYRVSVYTRFSDVYSPSAPGDWSPWRPLGGSSLTAGDGISITDNAVAVDDTVVRTEGNQIIEGTLQLVDGPSVTGPILVVRSASGRTRTEVNTHEILFCDDDDDDTTYVRFDRGGTSGALPETASGSIDVYESITGSFASLSVIAGEKGEYATAPSTRSTPVANEIITYNFLSNRYLPISGGTLTGGLFGTSVALSESIIDVSLGSCFTKTITAATTFAFTGVPSNATARFSLVLTNGGSQTVTWPSSVKWSGGANPELAASGVDVFTFLTADGGTTWYGVHSVQGAA